MVRLFILRCSCLVSVLLATGCSSYSQWRPLDEPTPVKPRDLVWIWSVGTVKKWKAVVITQDSVSGIPYQMRRGGRGSLRRPYRCGDSCRRTLPRTQVDSMKLEYLGHHIDSKEVVQVAGAVTLVLLAEVVVCTIIGATHDC